MSSDRAARCGWIGGFLGGCCWVPIVSLFLLLRHRDTVGGWGGLALFGVILLAAIGLRLWRHPDMQMRWLYLGALLSILAVAGFFLWRYLHIAGSEEFNGGVFGFAALSIPAFVFGGRTWRETHAGD